MFHGGSLYLIDRFYPSSKLCSSCGSVKDDLNLSDRVYKCVNKDCSLEIDRDYNASLNIKYYYLRKVFNKSTVSSTGIEAFGENVNLNGSSEKLSSLVELGSKHDEVLYAKIQ